MAMMGGGRGRVARLRPCHSNPHEAGSIAMRRRVHASHERAPAPDPGCSAADTSALGRRARGRPQRGRPLSAFRSWMRRRLGLAQMPRPLPTREHGRLACLRTWTQLRAKCNVSVAALIARAPRFRSSLKASKRHSPPNYRGLDDTFHDIQPRGPRQQPVCVSQPAALPCS